MTTILLMGPTAAGKSALALDLAQAFGGEIVSVDSAQVYRGMDIGTAKPDRATRERVRHHLLDIVDPTEPYSAARFAADANAAIGAIRARGRVPIVAGGTMLYFKALTEGLSDLPGGMPNTGKSTFFNRLTGARARIGNWPGVTVELLCAKVILGGDAVEVVDLPGVSDLHCYSDDERVVRHFLERNPVNRALLAAARRLR